MNEEREVSSNPIVKAVDSMYDMVISNKIPGVDSVEEIAISYINQNNTPLEAANSLVRWQNAKAAADGFATGLGGLAFQVVALPLNITSIMALQIRMIAAIAYIGGCRNFRNDKVKIFIKCCLAGESIQKVAKDMGIKITTQIALKKLIPMVSGKTLTKINQAVGFRLITKFGSKGVINLGRAVPLLGGLVGGTFDGVMTNIIGNVAIETFIKNGTVFDENGEVIDVE